MKIVRWIIVLVLIVAAFFAGRYSEDIVDEVLFRKPLAGQLDIIQEMHAWSMIDNEGVKPVAITVFAKNQSADDISGPVRFQIDLDSSGLEEGFIKSIIRVFGEERLVKQSRDLMGKNKAVSAYLARGKKLPEGMEYEPLEGKESDNYSTVVTRDLDIKAGETQKVELEAMIPPKYWGFVLSVKQI